MILTVCLNPTIQKTYQIGKIALDEINRISDYRIDASGKGINVSRVLVQLKKKVTHLTFAGGFFAKTFCDLALKDDIRLLTVESESNIRFCTTLLESNAPNSKNRVTELVEEGELVSENVEPKIKELFYSLLPSVRAIVISGSKAPGFSAELYPTLVEKALKLPIFVVLDYRGTDLINTLEKCKKNKNEKLIAKPNIDEFCETFLTQEEKEKLFANDNFDKEFFAQKLKNVSGQYNCDFVITRGTKSTLAFCRGSNSFIECENYELAENQKVVNTIGCGDAFTAGFVSALLDKNDFEECLKEGAKCGKLNAICLRPGSIL